MKFAIKKDLDKFLILLILTDFVFIFLHILHTYTSSIPSIRFSIERDRGFAETFQYIKEFWIVMLLVLLAMRRANFLYLSWSLLFFYVLIDDSSQIHERLGNLIASWLGFRSRFGLTEGNFGQLIVFFLFGAILLGLIALTHYRSGCADRRISKYLFSMIALLAFFGVIVDMVHAIVKHDIVAPVLLIIEEGGEMLVMSVITWFVFSSNS